MNEETNKPKGMAPKANIVSETNKEIMERPMKETEIKEVSPEEIEQANVIINPDPNTLDRG
ncbi:MAG: hypothetical protein LIO93_08135 [Bacteroidales bacterium]|nr:hypothetical protein [Bacteroidales bacterium]